MITFSIFKRFILIFSILNFSSAAASVGIFVNDGAENPREYASGVFSGNVHFHYGVLVYSCVLTMEAVFQTNPPESGVLFKVNDADFSSGGVLTSAICNAFSLTGFPWISEVIEEESLAALSNPDQSVDVKFNGISLNMCGAGLELTAKFNNNGTSALSSPSSLSFHGAHFSGTNCQLNGGLVVSGDDIDIFKGF